MNSSVTTSTDPVREQQFYQAYQPFKDTAPVELHSGYSDEEAECSSASLPTGMLECPCDGERTVDCG